MCHEPGNVHTSDQLPTGVASLPILPTYTNYRVFTLGVFPLMGWRLRAYCAVALGECADTGENGVCGQEGLFRIGAAEPSWHIEQDRSGDPSASAVRTQARIISASPRKLHCCCNCRRCQKGTSPISGRRLTVHPVCPIKAEKLCVPPKVERAADREGKEVEARD